MAHYNRERDIVDRYYGRKQLLAVYNAGKLIWERIRGFIFSSDGYALVSKDGYILKSKDQ